MSFLHLSVAESTDVDQLPDRIDIVTALHACNTATDDAIDFALKKQAEYMVLVPCCQAEVATVLRKNKGKDLGKSALTEMWRHPLHTREFGSQVTNVLRCLQLEAHGYQVNVTELVGWEHSMKNELIIASYKGLPRKRPTERLQEVLATLGMEEIGQRFYTRQLAEAESCRGRMRQAETKKTSEHWIDLRSDTVTQPAAAMRAAMAGAEVGDDVYGDDPTVNRLQEIAADMFGYEAALFAPSGTQTNLIALMAHCGRGDEYLVGQEAHTYSTKAAAPRSGQHPAAADRQPAGRQHALADIEAYIKPDDMHLRAPACWRWKTPSAAACWAPTTWQRPPRWRTRAAWPPTSTARASATPPSSGHQPARGHGRLRHRVGLPVEGPGRAGRLGPVRREGFIEQGKRWRKMLGGGMRQAGMLAAAGLYALRAQRRAPGRGPRQRRRAGARPVGDPAAGRHAANEHLLLDIPAAAMRRPARRARSASRSAPPSARACASSPTSTSTRLTSSARSTSSPHSSKTGANMTDDSIRLNKRLSEMMGARAPRPSATSPAAG